MHAGNDGTTRLATCALQLGALIQILLLVLMFSIIPLLKCILKTEYHFGVFLEEQKSKWYTTIPIKTILPFNTSLGYQACVEVAAFSRPSLSSWRTHTAV